MFERICTYQKRQASVLGRTVWNTGNGSGDNNNMVVVRGEGEGCENVPLPYAGNV